RERPLPRGGCRAHVVARLRRGRAPAGGRGRARAGRPVEGVRGPRAAPGLFGALERPIPRAGPAGPPRLPGGAGRAPGEVIPLKDDVTARRFPFVNLALIGLSLAAFAFELRLGPRLGGFLDSAAVLPALYTGRDHALSPVDALLTSFDPDLGRRVLVSLFLHGGWAHLLGNMLYLWIFGDNVEDRLGHLRYLAFYLLCGWTASYAHIWSQPVSGVPAIGASGAIAGVLGAYLTLYPRARVMALVPIGFIAPLVQLPAAVF